jgi:hypothetical protein
MRRIFNLILLIAGVSFFMTSCDKVDSLPNYADGTAPDLGASTVNIAPTPADSNKVALALAWSDPKYATDSNHVKFVVEIDSAGKNFANAVTLTTTKKLNAAFLAKELNNILVSRGYAFNVPVTMEVRVVSSYANNNQRLPSNVIKIKMTPYLVPPKVTPPSSKALYLVGSATAGGWGNPVPVPAQKFTRIDSVTYEGTFYLNGGQQYLLLPVNGDWSHKYAVANNTVAGLNAGGSFGYDLNDNFPGPDKTGFYKIRVDFQNGKFTVTQQSLIPLIYVPGDYQGWNPATAPTLGSLAADGKFDGYVNVPSGGSYEFKYTTTPDWSNALGDAGGGALSSSGGNLNFGGPGFYHLTADLNSSTWSATATTWSLIGSFAASGWNNDVDMTYDANDKSWQGTITTTASDEFKFRANHDWGLNYGDNNADGSLEKDGANIKISAGTHKISLYLNNSGYYTYKIE